MAHTRMPFSLAVLAVALALPLGAHVPAAPAQEPATDATASEPPAPPDPLTEAQAALAPGQRLSSLSMARTFVGDAYVRVVYSRPGKRGRANIFGTEEGGALVPYGKIWRSGANEATEITVTGDVVFNQDGVLPAGTYSVFSIPGAEKWTIHFNSALGLNGTARRNPATDEFEEAYDPANDVLVITATPTALAEEVDLFTIALEPKEGGAEMVWTWITTEVRVPVRRATS